MTNEINLLVNMTNQRFAKSFQTDQHVYVDEAIIPYYGKQFIKGKPIQFGYKMWCLHMTLGYLIQCQPYAVKCAILTYIGLGGSVVMELLDSLPKDVRFQVTFDNFLTSFSLLQALSEKGIGATGGQLCEGLPT